MRKALLVVSFAVAASACTDPGTVQIEGSGAVGGIAYIDRDGDGLLSVQDGSAQGVAAALLLEATGDTISRATSRADGSFLMPRIEAGRYRLVATRGTAGDSVEVLNVDSAQISLAAGDTVRRLVRLGYPRTTIAAMRALQSGRRITMDGIALNAWSAFGDSSLHFYDKTGSLRTIRVVQNPTIQPGDSITMVGTTGLANGRVVLADVIARVVVPSRGTPVPDSLSTSRAATADAGRLMDGIVRFAGALIRDTVTVPGNFRLIGVDDGSGRLEVLLNKNAAYPVEAFSPGARVGMTGVMVPAASGTAWQLKPRSPLDVTAIFPLVTTAQVRTLPSGSRVYVDGIALNAWATFGDSTMHLVGSGGTAIRAVRAVPPPAPGVAAGDSVQILGTTGVSSGRLALVDVTIRLIQSGRGVPPFDSVSTATAATAAGGARADGHVRLAGEIKDTMTVANDRILGVNDGSGRVEVVLDKDVSFNDLNLYVPGATFTGRGVLVPHPTNTSWRLKPRERDDAAVSFVVTTVANARTLAVGSSVVLEGRALNSRVTFNDSTVHLLDGSGAVRAVRVTGFVTQGDSIRLFGTMALRDGQPVVTTLSSMVLAAGVLPSPDSISTSRAASADGGARDAGQVRVSGKVITADPQPGGDRIFTINDNSGTVDVVYDKDIFLNPAPVPGQQLTASGVLVPTGTGRWQLKPRSSNDVSAAYPSVTIAVARGLPVGSVVQIVGVALNGRAQFSNGSLHIRDPSGFIRLLNTPQATVFAGDSVRVTATVGVNFGQPVLTSPYDGTIAVLLAGVGTGAIDSVTTQTASTASNGAIDAKLVVVSGQVTQVDQQGQDRRLTITDGTGGLVVYLDPQVTGGSQPYAMNDQIRVVGVLVPTNTGTTWELKPRSLSDISKSN